MFIQHSSILILLVCIGGCSEWPPQKSDYEQNYHEKKESLDRLAQKIRETDYWRVSLKRDSKVEVTPKSDLSAEDFIIDDDPEWHDLLVDSRMFLVVQRDDGSVTVDPGFSPFGDGDNRMGFGGYTHDPKLHTKSKVCKSAYKDIPCGHCIVDLGDNWFVWYRWYQDVSDQQQHDAYLNGELPLDEYSRVRDEARKQCVINGYRNMGYDVDETWEAEAK